MPFTVKAPPVGAFESAVRSKLVLPLRPALSVVETDWLPFVVAVALNEYVRVAPEPEADQFVPSAAPEGRVYEAMPVSLSVPLPVTSNEPPPAASGLK